MVRRIIHVVAVNEHGYIGKDNSMIWHNSEDLKHFKQLTLHQTVVVGRKTFDSIPTLKDRNVLVVSRNGLCKEHILNNTTEDLYIIGGGEIYKLFHPTHVILSRINNFEYGDVKYELPLHAELLELETKSTFTVEKYVVPAK